MRGAMLFPQRKRLNLPLASRIPRSSPSQTAAPELVPWRAWRSAAQKTTRGWNEWLAADSRERSELFHCFVCALAEEEQAAVAIERAINLEGNAEERSVSSALTAHRDESRPS
jgi:hypothetical protein